jgi:hypothetical protein
MREYVQTTQSSPSRVSWMANTTQNATAQSFFDFDQNLPLQYYGGEKPGEIYYLSALTINFFGIIDLSVAPNKLT